MSTNIRLTHRDNRILKYLWKWKVLSTHAIATKFFPEANVETAYKRLMLLKGKKFLKPLSVDENCKQFVWGLSSKGFKQIEQYLGELKIKRYSSSSPEHDHLATALHLGDWLLYQPPDSQTWSEQQLNCISKELWPSWVPKSELHRPDGLTAFNSNGRRHMLAFEAELHVKAASRYESVVAYYDSHDEIENVVWLVSTVGNSKSIQSAFQKHGMHKISKHSFVLLDEFRRLGWKARLISTDKNKKTLTDIIISVTQTNPRQIPDGSPTLQLLSAQKRPVLP